jgi:hypothetical protein
VRALAVIIAVMGLCSCGVPIKGITFGVTDPETGITLGGTYSSKGGLEGAVTITPTK